MSDISKSAISTDAEFEKAVAGASFEEIKVLMADRAIQQGLVHRDAFDKSVLIPTAPGTAPQKFAKAVVVNGVKHIIEGDSEQALLAAENEFYRSQFSQPVATETRTEVTRDALTGRFTRVDDPVAAAELELKFKRGEIDTATYLTESGAIEQHLAAQGIDPEALREASDQRLQKTWGNCVEEFLKSPAGADWPGGQENLRSMQSTLAAMNAEGEPSVENIAIAYKWLKDNNKLVENESVEAARRISEANSVEEIRNAVRGGSSLFGH